MFQTFFRKCSQSLHFCPKYFTRSINGLNFLLVPLAFLSTDLGHIFGKQCWQWFRSFEEKTHARVCLEHCSHAVFHVIKDLVDDNCVDDTKATLLRWFPFFPCSEAGTSKRLDSTWTIINLVTRNLDCCSKSLLVVVTLTWVPRVVKKPFVFVGITRLVMLFIKASNFLF